MNLSLNLRAYYLAIALYIFIKVPMASRPWL